MSHWPLFGDLMTPLGAASGTPRGESRKGQGVQMKSESHLQVRCPGRDSIRLPSRGWRTWGVWFGSGKTVRQGRPSFLNGGISVAPEGSSRASVGAGRQKESDFSRAAGWPTTEASPGCWAGVQTCPAWNSRAPWRLGPPRYSPGLSPVKATTLHPEGNP